MKDVDVNEVLNTAIKISKSEVNENDMLSFLKIALAYHSRLKNINVSALRLSRTIVQFENSTEGQSAYNLILFLLQDIDEIYLFNDADLESLEEADLINFVYLVVNAIFTLGLINSARQEDYNFATFLRKKLKTARSLTDELSFEDKGFIAFVKSLTNTFSFNHSVA